MRCINGFHLVGVLFLCAAIAPGIAPARPAFEALGTGSVYADAELIPDDVDAVLAIRQGAALRAGRAGPGLTSLTNTLFGSSRTARAWQRLAMQLEMEPGALFDAMLGERFTLVRRTTADGSSWAAITEVSLTTEAMLRKRLKTAPRMAVAGRPVLAVEEGEFWLATRLVPERRTAVVLLAPSDQPAMFHELAARFGRPAPSPLSAHPDFLKLRRQEKNAGAHALIYLRLPTGDRDYLALSASVEGRDLSFVSVARLSSEVDGEPVRLWSRSVFDAASEESLLTVMGWRDAGGMVMDLLRAVSDPLVTWPEQFSAPELIGPRWIVDVGLTPEGSASLAVARESTDIGALATVADRFAADQIARSRNLTDAERDALDFRGILPGSPRAARIATIDADAARDGIAAPIAALLARAPERNIAWSFARTTETVQGVQHPGWWVIAASPDAARALTERLEDAIPDGPIGGDPGAIPGAIPGGAGMLPWISVGRVHPARLSAWLAGLDMPLLAGAVASFGDTVRRLERIEWSVILPEGQSETVGWGSVRFVDEGEDVRMRPARPQSGESRRRTGPTRP